MLEGKKKVQNNDGENQIIENNNGSNKQDGKTIQNLNRSQTGQCNTINHNKDNTTNINGIIPGHDITPFNTQSFYSLNRPYAARIFRQKTITLKTLDGERSGEERIFTLNQNSLRESNQIKPNYKKKPLLASRSSIQLPSSTESASFIFPDNNLNNEKDVLNINNHIPTQNKNNETTLLQNTNPQQLKERLRKPNDQFQIVQTEKKVIEDSCFIKNLLNVHNIDGYSSEQTNDKEQSISSFEKEINMVSSIPFISAREEVFINEEESIVQCEKKGTSQDDYKTGAYDEKDIVVNNFVEGIIPSEYVENISLGFNTKQQQLLPSTIIESESILTPYNYHRNNYYPNHDDYSTLATTEEHHRQHITDKDNCDIETIKHPINTNTDHLHHPRKLNTKIKCSHSAYALREIADGCFLGLQKVIVSLTSSGNIMILRNGKARKIQKTYNKIDITNHPFIKMYELMERETQLKINQLFSLTLSQKKPGMSREIILFFEHESIRDQFLSDMVKVGIGMG